ncbi:MAG: valine--tRNA ligase [Alphaproteobacteria bacterium]|nr:valine--tRNA ligase [Alphaproteobacteria bacterium]
MSYKQTKSLDNKYNAKEIEQRCMRYWEEEQVYKYDRTASRENSFVIDTPPPTVSGSLHIGHIFSYTQTDAIARYQRMKGKSVFYPIGWDDNGLPTERRVQNYYNITCNPSLPYEEGFIPEHNPKDKSPLKEVSRRNFIEACETLTASDEGVFEDVFRNVGHSYDWSLKYTTISSSTIKISQTSFVDLFEKGKVASVEAPTMWDTTFQSAIAQAEIEDRDMPGHFHDLEFKIEGEEESFIIATTRPELLPACLAIVAHPEDERYQKFFGKKAIVPLFDIPVPIVPSEHAEMDKGTGIMMVCTFGDAADVAWWKKSGLPIKQVIGLNGRMLDVEYGKAPFDSLNPQKANENYSQIKGLKIKQAKEKIVDLLREEGALKGEPRPLVHPVKFYEKGSLPLEFVSSRQWFIKLLDEKERLIEAGKKIEWKPPYMQHRFVEWAEGLNQDWCISRQRFFGVPFPVWYPLDAQGEPDFDNPIVADKASLPVDPMTDTPKGYTEDQRGQVNGFVGDKDVMDTWATSALTPQIAMSGLGKEGHLSLPFDIRPQAHDIIRTWAFYTTAKALLHSNTIPWTKALISGFILDPDRKKMSKSKGNVVTPQGLIDTHSADAVRYWSTRARLGIDTAFDEKVMGQGKKFATKFFNASRFALSIISESSLSEEAFYEKHIQKPMDKAWMTKLQETVSSATKGFEQFDYAQALEVIEARFWDFCDNYLELIKSRAYSEDNASAVASLMKTIDVFTRLLAPFCPFITEEVYQACTWKNKEGSLHNESWPKAEEFNGLVDDKEGMLYDLTLPLIVEIRKAKTEAGKSQKTPVLSVKVMLPQTQMDVLKEGKEDIDNVGSLSSKALCLSEGKTFEIQEVLIDMDYIPPQKQK